VELVGACVPAVLGLHLRLDRDQIDQQFDGLTFGGPRNSPQFAGLFIDEVTDARDFMDFFDGSIASSGSGVLNFRVFGLDSGEDVLLVQRPDEFSSVVSFPGALPLLASGLLALGWMSRRRKA
jgi:hypothetical protein